MEECAAHSEPDRVGAFVRSILLDVGLRVGIVVALATIVIGWAAEFVLSWIPDRALQVGLGVRLSINSPMGGGARVARSLMAPWLIADHGHVGGATFSTRALPLLSFVLLVLVLIGAGAIVRRACRTLRARVTALLTAAVTTMVVLSAARTIRVLGAPSALSGLAKGASLGVAVFLILLLWKWISATSVRAQFIGQGAQSRWPRHRSAVSNERRGNCAHFTRWARLRCDASASVEVHAQALPA